MTMRTARTTVILEEGGHRKAMAEEGRTKDLIGLMGDRDQGAALLQALVGQGDTAEVREEGIQAEALAVMAAIQEAMVLLTLRMETSRRLSRRI